MIRFLSLPLFAGMLAISSSAIAAECMDHKYPPTMIKSFMDGCAEDPGYQGYCSCVIENLQKTITLYDFIEITNKTQGDGLEKNADFLKATTTCFASNPPKDTKEKEEKAKEEKPKE